MLLHCATGHIHEPAGILALVFGKGTERAARLRDGGCVTEMIMARNGELFEVSCRVESSDRRISGFVHSLFGDLHFAHFSQFLFYRMYMFVYVISWNGSAG